MSVSIGFRMDICPIPELTDSIPCASVARLFIVCQFELPSKFEKHATRSLDMQASLWTPSVHLSCV